MNKVSTRLTCRQLTGDDAKDMASIGFSWSVPHTPLEKANPEEAIRALHHPGTWAILGAFINKRLLVAMRVSLDKEESPTIDFDALESSKPEDNQLIEKGTVKLVNKILPKFKRDSITARLWLGSNEVYANRGVGVLNALIGNLQFRLDFGSNFKTGFQYMLTRAPCRAQKALADGPRQ